MDGISAIIELVTHLQDHALINIETGCRKFIHDRAAVPGIDKHKLANRLPDARQVTVEIAGGALLVINQEYFPGLHGYRLPKAITETPSSRSARWGLR